MATDGLTPCNDRIYKHGTVVMVTHTIPNNAMEGWVKKVATESGQPVDWHFFGGRACIKALGDLAKVREAIRKLLPEHDILFQKAILGLKIDYSFPPPRYFPVWGELQPP